MPVMSSSASDRSFITRNAALRGFLRPQKIRKWRVANHPAVTPLHSRAVVLHGQLPSGYIPSQLHVPCRHRVSVADDLKTRFTSGHVPRSSRRADPSSFAASTSGTSSGAGPYGRFPLTNAQSEAFVLADVPLMTRKENRRKVLIRIPHTATKPRDRGHVRLSSRKL